MSLKISILLCNHHHILCREHIHSVYKLRPAPFIFIAILVTRTLNMRANHLANFKYTIGYC